MVVSKKNILVTGSSGLIGSPLVKKLFVLGFNIIGLDPKQINMENSKYKHIKKNNKQLRHRHSGRHNNR